MRWDVACISARTDVYMRYSLTDIYMLYDIFIYDQKKHSSDAGIALAFFVRIASGSENARSVFPEYAL